MAIRSLLLVFGVLSFLYLTQLVSSDLYLDEEEDYLTIPNDQDAAVVVTVRGGNRRALEYIDCGGLCKKRCSGHSRPNMCGRACGTCCVRCKCVPPGTSGNQEMCGSCYTHMTTHRNKTKCP